MKLSFSGLLTACLVLAVAGAVAKVVALLIILALIAALITRPREMVGLATTLGILNLVALYPLPALGLAGALAVWRLRRGKASCRPPSVERSLDSRIDRISGRH